MQLVKVFNEHAQAGVQRNFGITRRELFFVMIQEEIEWIIWIHIDEDQIRVVHDQLAEAETIVLIGYVIPGAYIFHRLDIRAAKNLNNILAFHSYGDHLALDMGRGKDLFKIKDQIVLFSLHTRNFALLDQ